MKKVFSIFIVIVFLTSAMGLTINAHYCGMKLRSVSLTEKDCCCEAVPAEEKDDCCTNEIKYIKITDIYSPASQFQAEKVDIALALGCFVFPSSLVIRTSYFAFQSPPPKFSDPVIAFRTLLI